MVCLKVDHQVKLTSQRMVPKAQTSDAHPDRPSSCSGDEYLMLIGADIVHVRSNLSNI